MHDIILIEPKIPQNTGTIARLCAATNTKLILVGELGFSLDDKYLKRAGLDYWEHVNWEHQPDVESYIESLRLSGKTSYMLSSKAKKLYTDVTYCSSQPLIFGSETTGLSEAFKNDCPGECITIPMANNNIRSLNLANAVSIVHYEAIRQYNVKEL